MGPDGRERCTWNRMAERGVRGTGCPREVYDFLVRAVTFTRLIIDNKILCTSEIGLFIRN
jgi:hypothetical protein